MCYNEGLIPPDLRELDPLLAAQPPIWGIARRVGRVSNPPRRGRARTEGVNPSARQARTLANKLVAVVSRVTFINRPARNSWAKDRHAARLEESGAAQSRFAPAPVPVSALRRQYPRPHQCRLRPPANARRSAHGGTDLRAGGGHFLHRLSRFRDPQQSDFEPRRRPALDRANLDQLGVDLDGHDVRPRSLEFLSATDLVGFRRSRLLSGNHPLSHLLVSRARGPRPSRCS